jgi:hypothetical protein
MTFSFFVFVFCGGVVFASFAEYFLHRYVMHKPLPLPAIIRSIGTYAFNAHAVVHHGTFKADHTYHLLNEKDKHTIHMAWWNGPFLILVAVLPVIPFNFRYGHWWSLVPWTLAIACYYGAYEYMHWCMHLPKKRHVERSGIYFRLNGHHLLHHRYMRKNFNVVLPLADLCFGTLLLRSKAAFRQAEGPAVPNVQPRCLAYRAHGGQVRPL